MTSPQTYEKYHQICIDHYHDKISVEAFRTQLCDLFRPHEAIMRTLPTFFDESGEMSDKKAPERSGAGSSRKPAKAQSKAAAPKAATASSQQANGAQAAQSQ